MVRHRCGWALGPRRSDGIGNLLPRSICRETVERPFGSGVDDQLDPVAAAR